MAIEAFSFRMLCEARRRGASFAVTATLGRQHLSVRPSEARAVLRATGLPVPVALEHSGTAPAFADDVFGALLGAERTVSFDASPYQGASVVHDMNVPVAHEHRGAFDAVVDGGTLEHVFDFPTAIANCMRMVRVGGRFFSLTPANNHCGHGFYQFSPELFFRVFAPTNGFEVEHLLAVEHPFPGIELSSRRKVYAVRDPAAAGERVGLVNRRPVYLFVQAVKRAEVEPFSASPQQSDYAEAWNGAQRRPAARAPWAWRVHGALPYAAQRPLLGVFQRWRQDTFRNASHFRAWDQRGAPPPA